MRALAYAAALGQPAFALHISPTAEEADLFRGYWQTWGDHRPLEVMVSPHRAVVAPLVNYIWTLHRQRTDLTLTVTVPEVVDRHWRHRIFVRPPRPAAAAHPAGPARSDRHQRAIPDHGLTPVASGWLAQWQEGTTEPERLTRCLSNRRRAGPGP